MEFQTTIEVRVSDNKPLDEDFEAKLRRCLVLIDDWYPELIVKFVNTCKPSLGINITQNDISRVSEKITRECGK